MLKIGLALRAWILATRGLPAARVQKASVARGEFPRKSGSPDIDLEK